MFYKRVSIVWCKASLEGKVFGKFLVFWFCLSILITIASCSCDGNNNWDKQNHFCIQTIRLQTTARKGFLLHHSKAWISFKTLFEILIENPLATELQSLMTRVHIFSNGTRPRIRIWFIWIKLKTNFLLPCLRIVKRSWISYHEMSPLPYFPKTEKGKRRNINI